MAHFTYTINDPVTGDFMDFTQKAEAIRIAKMLDYTPVFIDIYDNDAQNIIDDIRIDNDNVQVIL